MSEPIKTDHQAIANKILANPNLYLIKAQMELEEAHASMPDIIQLRADATVAYKKSKRDSVRKHQQAGERATLIPILVGGDTADEKGQQIVAEGMLKHMNDTIDIVKYRIDTFKKMSANLDKTLKGFS